MCTGVCVGGGGELSESEEQGGLLLENTTSKHEIHRRILYVSWTADHTCGYSRKLGDSREQLPRFPHRPFNVQGPQV